MSHRVTIPKETIYGYYCAECASGVGAPDGWERWFSSRYLRDLAADSHKQNCAYTTAWIPPRITRLMKVLP